MHRARTTISCRFPAPIIALIAVLPTAAGGAAVFASDSAVFPSAIVWTAAIGSAPAAPPVIAGDRVIVALQAGQIVARRTADGEPIWTIDLLANGELAVDEKIVLVPLKGVIHALDLESGRSRWMKDTGPISAPPLVRGGWVILAAGEQLTAMRAADGAQVWTKKIALIEQRPAIDGDMLFASLADGRVIALDLRSGSLRWERQVGANPTEPFAYGDRLYFGAAGRNFVCLKAPTGEDDWSFPIGAAVRGTANADAQYVYVVSMDNLLRAFRRSNGALDWKQDIGYRPSAGPIVIGSVVAVPGRTTTIHAFDTTSRKGVAQLTLPDPAVVAPGIVGSDRVAMAFVTGDPGKPWLLSLTGPPSPSLPPVTPLTELPGVLLPAMRPPGL